MRIRPATPDPGGKIKRQIFLRLTDSVESEIGPENVRALEQIDRMDRIFQDLQDAGFA
ncbi:MAG: hypothetical protein SF339_18030 [Blastocatellia bacterium]|nr:hypothetical protein [Blastocatellia bacterium]